MEHTQEKTSSQILLEAANLLEEENRWHKGSFFELTGKGCSMCAHGAIAYCGNKDVRDKVTADIFSFDSFVAAPAQAAAAALAAIPAVHAALDVDADPHSIKEKYGETAVAHYKAFKVGLNYNFNDHPNTTKQDVIDKLREAAQM